jgi:hypothetical protein
LGLAGKEKLWTHSPWECVHSLAFPAKPK